MFPIFRDYPAIFSVTSAKKLDLEPIWARLLRRSQLSHPLDVPCLFNFPAFTENECIAMATLGNFNMELLL